VLGGLVVVGNVFPVDRLGGVGGAGQQRGGGGQRQRAQAVVAADGVFSHVGSSVTGGLIVAAWIATALLCKAHASAKVAWGRPFSICSRSDGQHLSQIETARTPVARTPSAHAHEEPVLE